MSGSTPESRSLIPLYSETGLFPDIKAAYPSIGSGPVSETLDLRLSLLDKSFLVFCAGMRVRPLSFHGLHTEENLRRDYTVSLRPFSFIGISAKYNSQDFGISSDVEATGTGQGKLTYYCFQVTSRRRGDMRRKTIEADVANMNSWLKKRKVQLEGKSLLHFRQKPTRPRHR